MLTFDPLDEDGEVVDGDSLAAHSEFWRPGCKIDGFRDESGDVWEVDRSAGLSFVSCVLCSWHVPRTDVMQIVTSG